MTDDLIATRASRMIAYREMRDAAASGGAASERYWWMVGLAMFALGLGSGLAWWFLSNLPGFDPLPRVLG